MFVIGNNMSFNTYIIEIHTYLNYDQQIILVTLEEKFLNILRVRKKKLLFINFFGSN